MKNRHKARASLAAAAVLLAVLFPAGGRSEEAPEVSKEASAVINAWVADIPSPAVITGVTGPVAILNKAENRYDLLEVGATLGYDDIVRMTPGSSLEVRYEDGSSGTFSYGDFPLASDETGMWVVFKKGDAGEAE